MHTITKPARYVRAFFASRAWARRAGVVLVPAALVMAGGAPAYAGVSTDVTGGAGDTFFTTIQNYFKDHVLVSVLGLLALVVGVSMLIGWGRKTAKSK